MCATPISETLVIASGAKQSRAYCACRPGLLRRFAPRNDEVGGSYEAGMTGERRSVQGLGRPFSALRLRVRPCLDRIGHRARDGPGLALRQQLGQAGVAAFAGPTVLFDHGAFERRTRVVVEDAEGHRERAEGHFHQHMGDGAVPDVVDDHAGGLPIAVRHIDHLQRKRLMIERDALGPTGEQHRLPIREPELAILRALGSGEIVEHVLVVDDAVLEDLDEGRALMGVGRLEHIGQMLRHVEPARHEARAAAQREGAGLRRPIDRTLRRGRGGRAQAAGGRGLALGKAVDLVVEQHDLHVHVAPQHVHQVIAADGQAVAVTRDQPYVEFRIGQLDAGGESRRAAVDRVEAVAFDVIGEPAGAADAADEHRLGRICADLRQGALHRLEDRIIPAARAPANFLVRFPVLEGGGDGGHVVHGFTAFSEPSS